MNTDATYNTSVRDFLHVLFKRKNHIFLFFASTVLVVAIGTLLANPKYEATSQILVKLGRENFYVPTVPTSGNLTPVISVNKEEQINSEIEILKSRFLAENAVKSLGPEAIYPDLDGSKGIFDWLFSRKNSRQSAVEKATLMVHKALEVTGIKKSQVIEVSFKHENSVVAATVVNTLVDLFLEHHVDVHKTSESQGFFRQQTSVLKDQLGQAENNLEAFKKKHAVSSLTEERSLLLKEVGDLRGGLNETLSREAEIEHRILQLKQQVTGTKKIIVLDEEIEHNPMTISKLQEQLVNLELKEQKLLGKYTVKSRLVQNVREEIEIVRAKLVDQEKRRYGSSRKGLNVTYQHLQEALFRNEAELEAVRAKKASQMAQLADYQKRLEKINRVEIKLNQLQQEVDVNRQNYRLYLAKFEESRISDAMDVQKIANVAVIQSATPPINPVSPKVLLNLVLALFLGAFGGLGLAFFMEFLDDSLEKDDDVERYLGLSVLGTIPSLAHQAKKRSSLADKKWFFGYKPRFGTTSFLFVSLMITAVLVVTQGMRDQKMPIAVQKKSLEKTLSSEEFGSAKPSLKKVAALATVAHVALPVAEAASSGEFDLSVENVEAIKIAETVSESMDKTKAPMGDMGKVISKENTKIEKQRFVIQVGAYKKKTNAEKLAANLRNTGRLAHVEQRTSSSLGLLHCVRVAGFESLEQAKKEMGMLRQQGLHDVYVAEDSTLFEDS